jgi:hypothetical protein
MIAACSICGVEVEEGERQEWEFVKHIDRVHDHGVLVGGLPPVERRRYVRLVFGWPVQPVADD